MALDKVIDSAKLDAALTATAEAIRAKTGSSDPIQWDEETGFKATVEAMEVGGGGSGEWEALMPATDITFADGGEYTSFENVYPLSLGASYKVSWAGSEYVCEAVATTFDDMPCVAIGNVGALAGNPSTEPFVIGYIPAANGFGIIRIDGLDEPVNVAIYKEKAAVVEGAHTITFMSEDGSAVLGTKPVMNGDTCGDPIALGLFPTPTKESDTGYDYTFYGWALTANGAADSNALVNITEDRTVYVNFAKTVKYYTVNFYDGETLLKTEQVAYNQKATPPNTDKDGFIFVEWTPNNLYITGDTDFVGTWTQTEILIYDASVSGSNHWSPYCYRSAAKTFNYGIEPNKNYRITLDGVDYECSSYPLSAYYEGGTSNTPVDWYAVIGNVRMITKYSNTTGYNMVYGDDVPTVDVPFIVVKELNVGMAIYGNYIYLKDTKIHTIKIVQIP